MGKKYKNMTNNEINIEMINLENKYKNCQNKIRDMISEMKKLDDEYNEARNELNNRKKGLF